ncbi:hypothetical protein GEMRC1_004166 [Eukaryota sp. GEM-RC1]
MKLLLGFLVLTSIAVALTDPSRDCTLCHRTINGIVPSHVRNMHFAQFFMNMACDRIMDLSASSRQTCKDFIQKNQNNLMSWVENKTAADEICNHMGKCVTPGEETDCDICLRTAGKLAEIIPSILTKEKYDGLAKEFCKTYASALDVSNDECLHFMDNASSGFLQTINEEGFPQLFCSQLEFCH